MEVEQVKWHAQRSFDGGLGDKGLGWEVLGRECRRAEDWSITGHGKNRPDSELEHRRRWRRRAERARREQWRTRGARTGTRRRTAAIDEVPRGRASSKATARAAEWAEELGIVTLGAGASTREGSASSMAGGWAGESSRELRPGASWGRETRRAGEKQLLIFISA
jgi:hypothetical protein